VRNKSFFFFRSSFTSISRCLALARSAAARASSRSCSNTTMRPWASPACTSKLAACSSNSAFSDSHAASFACSACTCAWEAEARPPNHPSKPAAANTSAQRPTQWFNGMTAAVVVLLLELPGDKEEAPLLSSAPSEGRESAASGVNAEGSSSVSMLPWLAVATASCAD